MLPMRVTSLAFCGRRVHHFSAQLVAFPACTRNGRRGFILEVLVLKDNHVSALAVGPTVLDKVLMNVLEEVHD